MRGASRASLAELTERLDAVTAAAPAAAADLGDQLFAVAGLLAGQPVLRRALGDPSRPAAARSSLATAVLSGKVGAATAELTAATAAGRWSAPGDLVAAVEELAARAVVIAAEQAGRLDELEDELFRFSRIVTSQADLRAALTNPFVAPQAKRQLLADLLADKVSPEAFRLISQAAANPLGRSLDASLEDYARIAAQRRERLVAEVHAAVPLTGEQRSRLAAALAASRGHEVHLNVVLDPRVAGGLTVRIGDELIDASVAGRMVGARRRLAS